ncbi:unnamed protein product [Polarella glacialis]|uniref:Uncharacterized protein n=2 Tax=Polarella glacialis TaxID=89957 RepID=A0A813LYV1_POLGL|nr:unnamed protein product [Polarella glacialis]
MSSLRRVSLAFAPVCLWGDVAAGGLVFASGQGNVVCWTQGFSYSLCCPEGAPDGNPECWRSGPPYSHDFCCKAQASCSTVFTRQEWDKLLLLADLDVQSPAVNRDFVLSLYDRLATDPLAETIFDNCPEGSLTLLFHAVRAFYHKGDFSKANSLLQSLFRTNSEQGAQVQLPMNMFINLLHSYTVDFPEIRRDLVAPHHPGQPPRSVLEQYQLRHFASVYPAFEQKILQGYLGGQAPEFKFWNPEMMRSEAFSVIAFCDLFGVSTIFESGVWDGWSASLWASWGARVVAVDMELRPAAGQRLEAFGSQVELLQGDGNKILAERVSGLVEDVAVVIDGPKGVEALRMARTLLVASKHVKFVAVHDARHWKGSPEIEEHGLQAFFYSNDAWFVNAYGSLDDACDTTECRYQQNVDKAFTMEKSGGGVFAFFTASPQMNATGVEITAATSGRGSSLSDLEREPAGYAWDDAAKHVDDPRILVKQQLRKNDNIKELHVVRSTSIRELVHTYGGQTGWEMRTVDGVTLFQSLLVGDAPLQTCSHHESGRSSLCLTLELVQDNF